MVVWCVMWCGVVWCDVMWCDVVWCDVVWCDVMWCDVMWCDVMWCDVMWCDVMWCDVMWCDVMWCDVMWCDVMWCDVMWCDVMWCDVMWCDVMWCDAMRCGVVSYLTNMPIFFIWPLSLFFQHVLAVHQTQTCGFFRNPINVPGQENIKIDYGSLVIRRTWNSQTWIREISSKLSLANSHPRFVRGVSQ